MSVCDENVPYGFHFINLSCDIIFRSMGRLTRLLTCYNPANPVALGERYGFRVRQRNANAGYDFLTGGAGVVFSRPLVEEIVDSEWCDCPASTAPDDMYLFGFCLKMIGTPVTHSPLFHQVRILT